MLGLDHTLITRRASVGVIGQKRPTFIDLESATYDWLDWSGRVETVSIPVGTTMFSLTYRHFDHTLLTPCAYFSMLSVLNIRVFDPL
jgi:hypothetical protein